MTNPSAPPNAFALKSTYLQAVNSLRSSLGLSVQGGSLRGIASVGILASFNIDASAFSFGAELVGSGIRITRGWLFYRGQTFFFPTRLFENADAVYFRFQVKVIPSEIVPGDPWQILSDDDVARAPSMVGGNLGETSTICEVRNPSGETITVSDGNVYVPIAMRHGTKIIRSTGRNQSWAIISNGSLFQTM